MPGTNTIGVIVPRLGGHFITSALKGIEHITTAQGYEVIITHSQENIDKEVENAQLLFERSVDGLIASLSAETGDLTHFEAFARSGIPVVFFDRAGKTRHSDMVVIDNSRCGFLATEHLIRQGCRRIAIVTANHHRHVYAQRYRGYREALDQYGIPFSKELLLLSDADCDGGARAAEHIMSLQPLPDGIFITSDMAAAMCMHVLNENGIRVPEDIAVVGFNNDPVSRLITPALTTIDYPGLEIGKTAAMSLLHHLKGRAPVERNSTAIVPAALIVRNSSLRLKN